MFTHNGVTVRESVGYAFRTLGQGIRCMEVGVKDGIHAKTMLDLLQPSIMYLVDVWEDIVITHHSTFHDIYHASAFRDCLELLKGYSNCVYVHDLSQKVLPKFPPNCLDFAYIDANHTEEAVEADVRNCVRLVRVGGVVGGHDYLVTNPLQMIALGVHNALGSLDEVSCAANVGEQDFWFTVTEEMKRRLEVD